jgi:hypothetical protein
MDLFSNGAEVDRERAAENDFERSVHQQATGSMVADQGTTAKEDHFEELIEAGVPEDTVNMLKNLVSRDFVLGNLTGAEVKEKKWLARNLAKRVFAAHPSQESNLTGEWREFILDEPNQGLKPLTDEQRTMIQTYIFNFIVRVTRSKGGWQQEEMSKRYTVSEMKSDDGSDDEGWFK